jgi:hypothetical protein
MLRGNSSYSLQSYENISNFAVGILKDLKDEKTIAYDDAVCTCRYMHCQGTKTDHAEHEQ